MENFSLLLVHAPVNSKLRLTVRKGLHIYIIYVYTCIGVEFEFIYIYDTLVRKVVH